MECGGENPTRLRIFIPDSSTHPPGMTLTRTAWTRLNRLRTGVGRFVKTDTIWQPTPQRQLVVMIIAVACRDLVMPGATA